MPAGGTETILFVDDEEALRSLATATLGAWDTASSRPGTGSMRWRATRKIGEIELVILDLIMPEMGGVNLPADTGHRSRREVLVSSAAGTDAGAFSPRRRGFLQKPYRLGTSPRLSDRLSAADPEA
jgi:DNA-binding NtrC family response regulator